MLSNYLVISSFSFSDIQEFKVTFDFSEIPDFTKDLILIVVANFLQTSAK